MTKRENVMAVLEGRQPDYYGDLMDAVQFVPDPVFLSDRAEPDGRPHRDTWGVTFRWEPGTPGPHPLAAPETLAIPDIERWEEADLFFGCEDDDAFGEELFYDRSDRCDRFDAEHEAHAGDGFHAFGTFHFLK